MVGFVQPILYIDLQSQIPAAFCPKCGRECYFPSLICLRCLDRCSDA